MSHEDGHAAGMRLLGVFAHPDDETFCAGGTLAKYVAAGAEAMVVSATKGQAGQIRDGRAATRRTLGEVRARELQRACEQLGVQQVQCLDYMDGTLRDSDHRQLLADVVRIIRQFRPTIVITFGDDGAYGHPDHITIAEITNRACAVAGQAHHAHDDSQGALAPHTPTCLYYAHFPRHRLLLEDKLASWLLEMHKTFRGSDDFVRALTVFAEESTTMRFAEDYVAVNWFPAGSCIVEQGEPSTSLYLILSGRAESIEEDASGAQRVVATLGGGDFFGELELLHHAPSPAHLVALESVTCLVLSPGAPTLYAGRGTMSRLPRTVSAARVGQPAAEGATTRIDVSAHLHQKIAALAAHHTQYPIRIDMFPPEMLHEMYGHEYFVRAHPPSALETELPGYDRNRPPH